MFNMHSKKSKRIMAIVIVAALVVAMVVSLLVYF